MGRGALAQRRPNRRSSIYFGKDSLWHGWVTVGVKADGSPDRRHRKGKTEAEVTRKVQELEGQRETGYVAKPGRVPTVAEWMREYLDVLCERLVLSEKMAPRTLADYRSKTRNWINPLLGKHRLDRLTPEHLDTAYTHHASPGSFAEYRPESSPDTFPRTADRGPARSDHAERRHPYRRSRGGSARDRAPDPR